MSTTYHLGVIKNKLCVTRCVHAPQNENLLNWRFVDPATNLFYSNNIGGLQLRAITGYWSGSGELRIYVLGSDYVQEVTYVQNSGQVNGLDRLPNRTPHPPRPGSVALACCEIGNSHDPLVFYLTSNGHICEVWKNQGAWNCRILDSEQVTPEQGKPMLPAHPESRLAAVTWGSLEPRVFYMDTNGDVNLIYWMAEPNRWYHRNITAVAKPVRGKTKVAKGRPDSYLDCGLDERGQYVTYEDAQSKKQENRHKLHWEDGIGWEQHN